MSRLRDKAAAINFEDLGTPAAASPAAAAVANAPDGAAKLGSSARPLLSGVAAVTRSIAAEHLAADLQAQVDFLQGGQRVVKLDPAKIRPSKWKNRHDLAYQTKAFRELKDEIAAAGGNVQPIKVRPVGKGASEEPVEGQEYELVFGRRRHRACLELGLPVNALIESLGEIDSFKEMVRENRHREDLSPWEAGEMYRDALDRGLFASQRQLALAVEIDPGNLTKMMKLAMLPREVIAAFPSPLDLQFRWAQPLDEAVAKDPDAIVEHAKALAARSPRPNAKEVFDALTGGDVVGNGSADVSRALMAGEKVVGSWKRDRKGNATLQLKAGALTPAKEKKLADFLSRLFE